MTVPVPCPGRRGRGSGCEFVQLMLSDKQGTCYIYRIAFSFLLLIGWGFPFLSVSVERTSWAVLFLEAVKLMVEGRDHSN